MSELMDHLMREMEQVTKENETLDQQVFELTFVVKLLIEQLIESDGKGFLKDLPELLERINKILDGSRKD